MYGLPADFDATVFIGRTVETVCFSENTVSVDFAGGLRVTLLGAYGHGGGGYGPRVDYRVGSGQCRVAGLAGKTVASATTDGDGSLALSMDDGQALICVDDSPQFESYIVFDGVREIIV